MTDTTRPDGVAELLAAVHEVLADSCDSEGEAQLSTAQYKRLHKAHAALIAPASKPAGITDEQIMQCAVGLLATGENLHKHDGYYYRSLGTPTNVRGSDLVLFARAVLALSHAKPAEVEKLRAAIAEALNVLGHGPCEVNTCEGCRYEHAEAVSILSVALAREGEAA